MICTKPTIPEPRSTEEAFFPLTQLPRELARLIGRPGPTYRHCYNLVLDGRLPAEKDGREYRIRRASLPAIAALFGLTPKSDTIAP